MTHHSETNSTQPQVLTPQEARQGRKTPTVLAVLVASTLLAVLALGIVAMTTTPDAEGEGAALIDHQVQMAQVSS